MKKSLGKISALLLAAILLVGLFAMTASAAVTTLPDETSERVLTIYKYAPTAGAGTNGDGTPVAGIATGRVPLENVEFEIYKVGTATTSLTPADDGVTVNETTHVATIPGALNATLVTTVRTNAEGKATYSFGTGTANDGIYLVVEKSNPAVEVPAAPFYVNMPLTNPTEDAWLYSVVVYPKNDVPEGPTVDKDVNTIDNETATTDIGAKHTWIIRGEIPADLYRVATDGTEVYAKNYTFTDVLDTRLDYVGNVVVKLSDKAGAEKNLTLGTHYTVTAPTGTPGGTLVVALTQAGMKFVQQSLAAGEATPEIRVYFDTAINDTAELNAKIPNDVTLDYTNSGNNEYEPTTVPPEEQPEVHMGGLTIDKYKTGAEGTKLSGAEFKIARDATADEIADAAVTKETIKVGTETKTVVFVDFYTTDTIEGTPVMTVTTDVNGKAIINGLAYGAYYLVETKAPDGYNLLTAPISVTISETSSVVANAVKVANSPKFTLPVTGGNGTFLFTMGGVLLIGLAAIVLLLSRKKKTQED